MTELRDPRRRLLPLLNSIRHGNRSHTTCFYKCGNACDAAVPNRSANPTFESVVQAAVSRRSLLKAAGISALAPAALSTFRRLKAVSTTSANVGLSLWFGTAASQALPHL